MNLKTGVIIFSLTVAVFSQITEEKAGKQSQAQITTQTAMLKTDIKLQKVKDDLISASKMSRTGAVLFGVGSAAEAAGLVCLLLSFSEDDLLYPGAAMLLGGFGAEFSGKLISCAGGSKARNALRYSLNKEPHFYGWPLFWCSVGMFAAGCAFPPLFIGDAVMSVITVVHSVHYANRAGKMQLSSNDFSVHPVVSLSKDRKTFGLVFSSAF
jgi:hypothetical protein